jgi:hypothetical protein
MGFPSHSASAAAAPRDRLVGTLGTHLLAVLENWLLIRRVRTEIDRPRRAVPPGQQISRSDFGRIANGTPERQGRANRRST